MHKAAQAAGFTKKFRCVSKFSSCLFQVVKSDNTDVTIRELKDEKREQNDGLLVARSELRMRSLQHAAVMVRCIVTLFDVYTATAEHRIRSIAPPPAPMMGPTAPLGLSDSAISKCFFFFFSFFGILENFVINCGPFFSL